MFGGGGMTAENSEAEKSVPVRSSSEIDERTARLEFAE